MKLYYSILGAMMILFAAAAIAGPTAQDQADKAQIDTACSQDAQTAGCGGEVVGKGLLKCLHHYKHTQRQTNKAFQFSAGCEAAIKQLRTDKSEGK